MIAGHLPPSSSVTGTSCSAAALAISRPIAGLPVYSRWSQRTPRERARQLETADDHVDAVAVEGGVDHLAQQLGAGGRVLGRLDHDAIARGEHLDQRADGQVEGEVPGHDVADHALRLRLHEGAAGPVQGGVRVARLGRHPAAQLFGDVHGAAGRAEHFDQVGRQRRMHAEVAAQRLLDLRAVADQHRRQRSEQLLSLLERGERVGQEGGALALHDLLQLGDRVLIAGGGGAVLDGGHHLSSGRVRSTLRLHRCLCHSVAPRRRPPRRSAPER